MTENRFMLDDAGELIDLNNHKFVDYGEECCNLLNKLHEKNQFLKKQFNIYRDASKRDAREIKESMEEIDKLLEDIDELYEENQQLKKQREELFIRERNTKNELRELKKENKELNSIKCFANNNGINIFKIDEAFRKCWNDNTKLVSENRKLIRIIDAANDLIKSHLSSHYNRNWVCYCKNNGLNLKELEEVECPKNDLN